MRRGGTVDGAAITAAAEWRLLGLLLERPRPGWHEEIAALAGEVADPAFRAAAAAAQTATEGAYLRVLGPGGLTSPRQVAYCGLADPGHILAQLSELYALFAYRPRAEDPFDHVAVEVGFVGYLWLKEAFARAAGQTEAAETAAHARTHFLAAHLANVGHGLVQRLAEAAAPPHLLAAARILADRVPRPVEPVGVVGEGDAFSECGACPVV